MELIPELGWDKRGGPGQWMQEAAKAGLEEITGEVCSHDFRGGCSRESDGDVMSVGRERL